MPHRTILDDVAVEGADFLISGVMRGEHNQRVMAIELGTLLLTLYGLDPARTLLLDRVAILNVGRGVVDQDGNYEIRLAAADNVILEPTRWLERHVARLDWTTVTGGTGRHEIEFSVANFDKVPALGAPAASLRVMFPGVLGYR